MTIRNIVRPASIYTTPKLLQETLNAKRVRKWPQANILRRESYDFDRDLFLIYPDPAVVQVENKEKYRDLYRFFSASKPVQRGLLEQFGVSTVPFITRRDAADELLTKRYTKENTFIVRPMRHSGGRDYKVTIDPRDFEEGKEYRQCCSPNVGNTG